MSSASGSSNVKTNENIKAYVRVRPINAREQGAQSHEIICIASHQEIIVQQPLECSRISKKFHFDGIFGPDSQQSDVYHSVMSPLIEEVLLGYNCTVFAYGQTGTGKTHTMIGSKCPQLKLSWEDDTMSGIIPRAVSQIFDELHLMKVEFSMRVSYLELFNEELHNLLPNDEDASKIRIYDDANKKGSVIIQGLKEIKVHTKDGVFKLLEKGQVRRKTATTIMNEHSSRSHTIFSITVHIKENGKDGEEMLKIGTLNLVDLAGSENVTKAGHEKRSRTRETVKINQSLLVLGRCITALVERAPHIPYRESKLTRLLQESLGGTTKTSIIATISPSDKEIDETLNTLAYAHRAKNIHNTPELNQKITKKTVLKEYIEEIDKLKRDLLASREQRGVYLAAEKYNNMQYTLENQNQEIKEKMLLIEVLKDELAKREEIFNELSFHLAQKSEECMKIEQTFSGTKIELDQAKEEIITTKRKYKEKIHLLGNHSKTEQELTCQVKKLMEVVDLATTDTNQLHDTIDRRKEVDIEIQTSCDKFTESLKESISEIAVALNNLEEKQNAHNNAITEEINLNGHHYKKLSTEITESILTLSDIYNDFMKAIGLCVDKASNLITNGDNDHHQNIIQKVIHEFKQKQNEFQSHIDFRLKQIMQIIDVQKVFAKLHSDNVISKVSDNHRLLRSFSTNCMGQLESCMEDVAHSLENQSTNLILADENRKNISNEKIKIMKKMESLMEKLKIIDQNEQSATSEIEIVSQNVQLTRDRIFENMNTNKNKIDTLKKDCSIQSAELEKCVNDFKTSITATSSSEKLVVNSLEKLSVNHNKKFLENIDSISDLDIQRTEERNIILESVNKDVNELSQETSTHIDYECRLINEATHQEYERIQTFHRKSLAFKNSSLDNLGEYSSVCREQIMKSADRIETFRNNEVKTYTPTGKYKVETSTNREKENQKHNRDFPF